MSDSKLKVESGRATFGTEKDGVTPKIRLYVRLADLDLGAETILFKMSAWQLHSDMTQYAQSILDGKVDIDLGRRLSGPLEEAYNDDTAEVIESV